MPILVAQESVRIRLAWPFVHDRFISEFRALADHSELQPVTNWLFALTIRDGHINFGYGRRVRSLPQPLADTAASSHRLEQINRRRLKQANGFDQIRFPRAVGTYKHVQRMKLEFRGIGTERQNVPQLDGSQKSLVAEHSVSILLAQKALGRVASVLTRPATRKCCP